MHYLFFSVFFFISIFLVLATLLLFLLHRKLLTSTLLFLLSLWFVPYSVFFLFFTGPRDLSQYPDPASSPYRLPWKVGVTRFVAQGNNSFTTHRGLRPHAWDFMMANGTPILAARGGVVDEIVQNFDGIGLDSNYIHIRHEDESVGGYAHMKKNSSLVKVGEKIYQGQAIALSGMVGQTIMPHLHFYVLNKEKTDSIPVSFSDAGVPLAGRSYTSNNAEFKNSRKHLMAAGPILDVYTQPEIQCTIVEIGDNSKIFGIDVKQFDSISHDAVQSKLGIANQLVDSKPKQIKKSKDYEEVGISQGNQKLILKIHGEPISRNGTLELNGEQIAKITCH